MKIDIHYLYHLARVRIFTIRDLWMFIIAIILISMTSSALTSIIVGINPTGFFLGEEEDILVITSPGISTPMTGNVHLSMMYDLQKIPGVRTVSPEVLGVTVAQNLNQKNVVIRGITSYFLNITDNIQMNGKWFDSLTGNFTDYHTYEVVAGKKLAEDLQLEIGSTITLVGTLTAITMDLSICGIVETNTPIDSELIVSLSMAQSLTGRSSEYSSFLRVQVTTEVLSKVGLQSIVNGPFKVPITFTIKDPFIYSIIEDIPVYIYSPAGELLESGNPNQFGEIVFQLPFGSYRLVVDVSQVNEYIMEEIFVNRSLNTPLNYELGKERHSLTVITTYNTQFGKNACVSISKVRTNERIYVDTLLSSGYGIFHNLTTGDYRITVEINCTSNVSFINIHEDRTLQIDIFNSASLMIRNSSTLEEIIEGTLSIFSSTMEHVYPTNIPHYSSSFIYKSNDILYFENPDVYLFNFTKGGISRIISINILGNVEEEFEVGKERLSIQSYKDNTSTPINTNISIYKDGELLISNQTAFGGTAEFLLPIGNQYSIEVINLEDNHRLVEEIKFVKEIEENITFHSNYTLSFQTLNGTASVSENLINSVLLTISGNGFEEILLSNESGKAEITLLKPGIYSVNAIYGNFSWKNNITVIDSYLDIIIPLGNVYFDITLLTVDKVPINNFPIDLFDNENSTIHNKTSDIQGKIRFIIPTGKYRIPLSETECSMCKTVDLSYSQIYSINLTLHRYSKVSLLIHDQQDNPIGKIPVNLINTFYNITLTGLTNDQGVIIFNSVLWGSYEVEVQVLAQELVKVDINIQKTIMKGEIGIEINLLQEIGDISVIKWSGRSVVSVVESEEFLSGFLETTLQVAQTSLIALVLAVTILSLFSVSSVIAFPIRNHFYDLKILKSMGSTKDQITFIIAIKMAIIGFIASIAGSFVGLWIISIIPFLRTSNIGGLLIESSNNPIILIGIVIVIVMVSFIISAKVIKNEAFNGTEMV